MNAARRCSALLGQLYAPPKKSLPAAGGRLQPGTRRCHPGVGATGAAGVKVASGASSSGTPAAVCPMGSSSSSSSSSRSFGTLAQTLTSAPLEQTEECLEKEPGQDRAPDQDLGETDPELLLRECEEALQRRPARPHRDLVHLNCMAPCRRKHSPPIRVMQWNILAQALGEGKDGFIRCPLDALNWQERKYLILEEILTYRPDVLCLQEVDHYHDTFQPVLSRLGYSGTFLAKPWSPCLDVAPNNGPDGCALFYRRSRFSPRATSRLRLSAMMLPTNQVAIVQTLACAATGRQLCVAVTHLKARSGWERLRGAQGAHLLRRLRGIAPQGAGVPLVVCGDFNAEPREEVYRRFSSSPLGLDSAYKLLSPDGQTEPAYTTWKIRPSGESRGTLDYIWYSRGSLSVDCLLDIPSEEQIGPDRLPSYHYPSDHLSLVCDLSFKQERNGLV